MHQWRAFFERGLEIDDRVERLIADEDLGNGILGNVATFGHHHDHRLADVADLVFGKRHLGALVEPNSLDRRRRHQQRSRLPVVSQILGRVDRDHPFTRERALGVDGAESSMSERTADKGHVHHVLEFDVVHEERAAGQKLRIFVARDALAEGSGRHEFERPF